MLLLEKEKGLLSRLTALLLAQLTVMTPPLGNFTLWNAQLHELYSPSKALHKRYSAYLKLACYLIFAVFDILFNL